MSGFGEDAVEVWALEIFEDAGWQSAHGTDLALGATTAERSAWTDVVLRGRLEAAVARLNPHIPAAQQGEAIRELLRVTTQSLAEDNHAVHLMLLHGVHVEVEDEQGRRQRPVRFIDFDQPANNDYVAVRQIIIRDRVDGIDHNRRADVIGFVNGLPLVVVELKNPSDEEATVKTAWGQLQTYKAELPTLFRYNAALVIADGPDARVGSLTAGFEHFAPWKTIDGARDRDLDMAGLEVAIRGLFDPGRFLTWMRDYTVFADEKTGLVKRTAKYHQYWAVEKAIAATIRAVAGDGRVGVVWHTQGSGKSFEMHCYAAKIIRTPAMQNPTVVMLTDRNDLDDQLHDEVFLPSAGRGFLPEDPQKAESRAHLRQLLTRTGGGIVFTTVQKFAPGDDDDRMPLLSDRSNIVVVADEAHRSQYDFLDGFARHLRDALPNAAFLGFTGTPLDRDDKSTVAVFGDYIDTYDITDAIEDGATVPIFYESRLVKVSLPDTAAAELDARSDEALADLDKDSRAAVQRRWTSSAAVIGAPARIRQVAADIVDHWERRRDAIAGKGMIVAFDRPTAVALFDELVKLRPSWHDADDARGKIKVVMSGDASETQWQTHIRSKGERNDLKLRAKNSDDELELVIVVDMWLTGFDSPPMHTLYIDKPLKAHNLMQAIARVNRTWRDKPAGLIVDYIGITDDLRRALANYSDTDQEQVGISLDQAVLALETTYGIVASLLNGHPWPKGEQNLGKLMAGVAPTAEWLLGNDVTSDSASDEDANNLVERYKDQSLALAKAHALAASHPRARELADDVKFLLTVRAHLLKFDSTGPRAIERGAADTALQQLIAASISTDGVVDVFAEAGLTNPDLSIFSDEFLDKVQQLEGQENLRIKMLQKLLNDEVRSLRATSVVRHEQFSEQLQRAINRYRTRALTSAQIIEELIELARALREAQNAGEESGLTREEYAFYEAVAQNGAALIEMGDDKLKALASELVANLKNEVTIDWDRKASVQSAIRAKVSRLLMLRGYPPDYSEAAIQLVLAQTELFARQWTGGEG